MLSKFSIRGKVIAVVSVLLLAMSAVGIVALNEISAVNSRLVEIQSNWLQGVLALGEMQATVLRHQTAIRDHLLADDPETKSQAEQAISALEQEIKQTFSSYEALKPASNDRAIYKEFRSVWDEYSDCGNRGADRIQKSGLCYRPGCVHGQAIPAQRANR